MVFNRQKERVDANSESPARTYPSVGRGFLPNHIVDGAVETEYLDFFTRNIQSFGLSLIGVVSDIDETWKTDLRLASQ